MQRVTIYKYENQLFIKSSSQTVEGYWVDNGFLETVEIFEKDEVVKKVNDALSKSTTGIIKIITTNADLDEMMKPLLAYTNTLTWKRFASNAKCVNVSRNGIALKVMPTKRCGIQFNHLPKQNIEVKNNLYESIIQCLDIST